MTSANAIAQIAIAEPEKRHPPSFYGRLLMLAAMGPYQYCSWWGGIVSHRENGA